MGLQFFFLLFWLYFRLFRYELAEECADDDDAKAAISKLRKGVLEELKMHDSFVQVRHELFVLLKFCFYANLLKKIRSY